MLIVKLNLQGLNQVVIEMVEKYTITIFWPGSFLNTAHNFQRLLL
jgi:hypothetical protein